MLWLDDSDVKKLINMPEAIGVMREVFEHYGKNGGAILDRHRAHHQSNSLSVMGAILGHEQVSGIKAYSTINGQFNFLISLFSMQSGELLASMQGNALTEFRTAAVTRLAMEELALPTATCMTIFGTGIQARAHARALIPLSGIQQVYVVGLENVEEFCQQIQDLYEVKASPANAESALPLSDIVVTTTRSKTPLFDSALIKPGCFIAAIGSSKPDTREIDEALMQRAALIAVEWKPQTIREAGEFQLLASTEFNWDKIVELGSLLNQPLPHQLDSQAVRIYKSVGIGLEDVALANFLYHRAMHRNYGRTL